MIAEQLEFDFTFACPAVDAQYYREGAQDLIRRLVPRELLEEDLLQSSLQRARFSEMVPFVFWSDLSRAPCTLSVLLLCQYRLNACNFFYDLISRWLLPQKKVNVELFFSSDVRLPHLSDGVLSVAEIVIELKSAQDVELVRRNLSAIESELRLGICSDYHARRILEFKGLSSDGKTAMIQEKITSLIQSRSQDFDKGIFSQMQQFLVTCTEEFKQKRDYHHISRIISNLYSLRKVLSRNVESIPSKRHLQLKLFKTKLSSSKEGGGHFVLGVLVSLNFLREHEVFDVLHLASAIQTFLPSVQVVNHSPFVDRDSTQKIQTIYLEIEKESGEDFSFDEIHRLKAGLPEQIKGHIEQLAHPIFMPRNEEEVLRNILALSYQLRFVGDLPQVVLSFDEQKEDKLYFTVIVVRVLRDGDQTLQEIFEQTKTSLAYVPDRVRRVGHLRRKYYKEATVFRTCVADQKFLREDYSIDTYEAREYILSELTRVLGEVRDYNGGMIHKQKQLLDTLKQAVRRQAQAHSVVLEDFFFSLSPIEMRTTLEIEPLKQFFLLFLQARKMETKQVRQDGKKAMVVTPVGSFSEKERFFRKVRILGFAMHQLVFFELKCEEGSFIGFLLFSEEKEKQACLLEIF